MVRVGLCSSSDVITFDQNWHHLYSRSAGGKDLYSSLEHEICTKMLRDLSKKVKENFPVMHLATPW